MDKQNSDPTLILDLSKVNIFIISPNCSDWTNHLSQVFHVRSVTQGDVIRADAKDIPRIFQVD